MSLTYIALLCNTKKTDTEVFAFSEHALCQRKFNYAIRQLHQRLLHSLDGYIILYNSQYHTCILVFSGTCVL
jgi:hypothetical protein